MPALDAQFRPAALAHRAFREQVRKSKNPLPVRLALEQTDESVYHFNTDIFSENAPEAAGNYTYLERILKFLLCPSGGMFGPAKNDGFLQERSRENKVNIVFVHPCEFLVTGPDGAILSRTLLGDSLLVTPAQMDSEMDARKVFFFDLPITPR